MKCIWRDGSSTELDFEPDVLYAIWRAALKGQIECRISVRHKKYMLFYDVRYLSGNETFSEAIMLNFNSTPPHER